MNGRKTTVLVNRYEAKKGKNRAFTELNLTEKLIVNRQTTVSVGWMSRY
jgi:hypothetical protein